MTTAPIPRSSGSPLDVTVARYLHAFPASDSTRAWLAGIAGTRVGVKTAQEAYLDFYGQYFFDTDDERNRIARDSPSCVATWRSITNGVARGVEGMALMEKAHEGFEEDCRRAKREVPDKIPAIDFLSDDDVSPAIKEVDSNEFVRTAVEAVEELSMVLEELSNQIRSHIPQ
ncbi:hypothetical protein [Streptomyces sp. NPDC047028]|uniref:hypothetical protein n=1 Tax=Streptomyces sp. NPDC047028 TaxID=3155793 RepID=UPI0033D78CB6